MSLLNLSLAEFIAVFTTVSALLVTLYLLDRSRRRVPAATLRFWRPAGSSPQQTQKKRIQQPWSLILQLLSIALLLLALAQLQWGTKSRGRDHVLLLDRSAWMNARTPAGSLMDEARAAALAYVRALPTADRVLLVRADGLATPAGALESNRAQTERAIRATEAGSSGLNLQQAFDFARQFERLHAASAGEIVFVGAGHIDAGEPLSAPPPGLRVLPIATRVENAGLRKMGLKRSEQDPSSWEVFVTARNYGPSPRIVPLELRFAGALVGARSLTLQPGVDEGATFLVRTRAAGMLEARLALKDALPEDDRAVLELPAQRVLNVVVYSPEPDSLRPVLSANPHVRAEFRAPSSYSNSPGPDVVIFDRFAPPEAPAIASIWIDPPAGKSPVPVRASVEKVKLSVWNSEHELGSGLRTRDVEIESAKTLQPGRDDITVASADEGPLVVAREAKGKTPKTIVFGFHPVRSGMRYELATPLLFANALRWMHPDLFRRWELNARPVGTVTATLERDVDPRNVTVRSDTNEPVPYTVEGDQTRFFSGTPGNIRLLFGDRELVYSLTLPELGDAVWTAPAGVRRGVPKRNTSDPTPIDLWPWLALAGAAGLTLEWMMYGRGQRRIRPASARAVGTVRKYWGRKAS